MEIKLKVAFLFGGRSTEHEVSVITALQAYENLSRDKYEVIPVYVDKNGDFYTNEKFLAIKNYQDIKSLLLSSKKVILGRKGTQGGLYILGFVNKFIPIDVAFPLFHGSFGEDGCIQGLFEMYRLPYVGFNVLGSAISMDKDISKAFFKYLGFNVGKSITVLRNDWIKDSKSQLKLIKDSLKLPVFVKPADIGSTIGINKAKNEEDLQFSIEVAAVYSDKVIVEEAFENCIEVNCAALGYKEAVVSACEMPIRSGEALSYEDKYLKGSKNSKGSQGSGLASLSRKIPAPIPDKLASLIQEATLKIFKSLEGCGVARIDYFVDQDQEKFWVNEVNTPPGSLAFYLFEPKGLKYQEQLDIHIKDALERFKNQQQTQFTFDSSLLEQMAKKGGTAGTSGTKS